MNLHENILKGWKDLVKAMFFVPVINTQTEAEFKEKGFFSIRDTLSNLNDKLIKVLEYV